MTWNNRIIRFEENGSTFYRLCETFYDDNGKVYGYAEHNEVQADSPEELIELLTFMLKDAAKYKDQILDAAELGWKKP